MTETLLRTKVIEVSGFLEKGERRITPVVFSSEYKKYELDDRMSKTAACDDARNFVANLKPIPGCKILLSSAMGSMDAWGCNKKGDAFTEAGLLGNHPVDVDRSYFEKYAHRIPPVWGLPSYPTKWDAQGRQIDGGNTYHEHINRPPMYNGVFGAPGTDCRKGDILAAFWNSVMRRLEVVHTIWISTMREMCRAIDEGFLPGVSMAGDVPFDRCTICGHLSINDSTYCDHLHRSRGLRGKMWSDRRLIAMINDYIKLRDLSVVANPAAEEGRTLAKVASAGLDLPEVYFYDREEGFTVLNRKEAAEAVNARVLQAERMNEPPFSMSVINALSKYPLRKAASYLAQLGMYPTGADIARFLFKSANADEIGREVESALLPLLNKEISFDKRPEVPEVGTKVASDDDGFVAGEFADVLSIVKEYMPLKSYWPQYRNSRKSASRTIDIDKPLANLSDEAKAILITRIFMDKDIMAKLQNSLVAPVVMWELEKNRLGYHPGPENSLPVYGNLARAYLGDLEAARGRFYGN